MVMFHSYVSHNQRVGLETLELDRQMLFDDVLVKTVLFNSYDVYITGGQCFTC